MPTIGPDGPFLDSLFSVLFYVVGSFGILANALLISVITFRTPTALRGYRILLLNQASIDLLFSVLLTLSQFRLTMTGWFTFVYYDLGPLRHTPPGLQLLAHCLALNNLLPSFFSTPLSFAYRYLVLVERERPTCIASRNLKIFALLTHGAALMATIPYAWGAESHEYLQEQVQLTHPSYNISDHVLYGTNLLRSPHLFFSFVVPTLPVFPAFLLTLFFKSKTMVYLNSHRDSMSPGTLSIHRRVAKVASPGIASESAFQALSVQSTLPFFFLLAPVSVFLVVWFCQLSVPLVEYSLFLCTAVIALLNPIATFYFITPYKKTLWRWFYVATGRRRSSVTPIWLSMSNSVVVLPSPSHRKSRSNNIL
ncbi:hypothetical protein QR680_005143 [Steinernema hermaphroditum]|uniref:G-protein coupled receptors family 1 profile domain-containing protein n=1 Tax=Steinernema hermaphroditum TaxID=289476 RepID=A0AA39LUU1_9BILA|nr:hypothetical protein QR680_005143 [Steinernema hermaphroditum]